MTKQSISRSCIIGALAEWYGVDRILISQATGSLVCAPLQPKAVNHLDRFTSNERYSLK